MKPLSWVLRLPPRLRASALRWGINLYPAFRASGGRVVAVSPALDHIRVRLPLTWRTRNLNGSLYGGSLFAVTDGLHPTLLMAALGPGVVVWDKAASIRFRRPGRSALYADFRLRPEELAAVREALARDGETERHWTVALTDRHGTVHAEVERCIYIATRHHYRHKNQQYTARSASDAPPTPEETRCKPQP